MQRWIQGLRPTPPVFPPTDDPNDTALYNLITIAHNKQCNIGWAHFFRGRISLAWRDVLTHYYRYRRPPEPHSPKLWMRKTIDQIWNLYLSLWQCRNGELHGPDFETTRKKALDATRASVQRAFAQTQGNVSDYDRRLLHRHPVSEILAWTKSHLDAYLATAEVILEQNVEPG